MDKSVATAAARGLAVTIVPLAALAAVNLYFAPQIVERIVGVDPAIETWAVPALRGALIEGYLVVTAIVIGYWLFSAAFGRGQILDVRCANMALGLSGLIFALTVLIASIFPTPWTLFEWVCPILGLSQEYPKFGFDVQSSCENFTRMVVPAVLLGVPMILLIGSAVLRIIVSRRKPPPTIATHNS